MLDIPLNILVLKRGVSYIECKLRAHQLESLEQMSTKASLS